MSSAELKEADLTRLTSETVFASIMLTITVGALIETPDVTQCEAHSGNELCAQLKAAYVATFGLVCVSILTGVSTVAHHVHMHTRHCSARHTHGAPCTHTMYAYNLPCPHQAYPHCTGERLFPWLVPRDALWGPLFEGVVSTQRFLSLRHVVVSGLRSGGNLLRTVQHKKPLEKSFW